MGMFRSMVFSLFNSSISFFSLVVWFKFLSSIDEETDLIDKLLLLGFGGMKWFV